MSRKIIAKYAKISIGYKYNKQMKYWCSLHNPSPEFLISYIEMAIKYNLDWYLTIGSLSISCHHYTSKRELEQAWAGTIIDKIYKSEQINKLLNIMIERIRNELRINER